jgi:hypothetical protein
MKAMDNKFTILSSNLLDRRESDAQTPTLVNSAVTNEKFQSVMSEFGIVSIDETEDVPDIPQEFLVFDWHNNAENDTIPDALNHLQTELKNLVVCLGEVDIKFLMFTRTSRSQIFKTRKSLRCLEHLIW